MTYEHFDQMGVCTRGDSEAVLEGVEPMGLLGEVENDNGFFKVIVWLNVETQTLTKEGPVEIFKSVARGRLGVFKQTREVFPRRLKGKAQWLEVDLLWETLKARGCFRKMTIDEDDLVGVPHEVEVQRF